MTLKIKNTYPVLRLIVVRGTSSRGIGKAVDNGTERHCAWKALHTNTGFLQRCPTEFIRNSPGNWGVVICVCWLLLSKGKLNFAYPHDRKQIGDLEPGAHQSPAPSLPWRPGEKGAAFLSEDTSRSWFQGPQGTLPGDRVARHSLSL